MSMNDDLKEPTFGPIVTDSEVKGSQASTGWKGGAAVADADLSDDDVSAPEEENESRIPGDPRAINEQQPPTAFEF